MVRIDQIDLLSEEEKRLKEDREKTKYWKKWGPYVAERQWATGIYPTYFVVFDPNADNIVKFVRITVLMVMPGAVSSVSSFNQWQLINCLQILPTTMPAQGRLGGEKMALLVCQTHTASRT